MECPPVNTARKLLKLIYECHLELFHATSCVLQKLLCHASYRKTQNHQTPLAL